MLRLTVLALPLLLAGCSSPGVSLSEPPAKLGDITWSYDDLFCEDAVPVTVSFRNVGEVLAKDVVVTVTIANTNEVAQDSGTKSFGAVAAGSGAMSANFRLFAPDSCGRDDYYRLAIEADASNAPSATARTSPFSI